MIHNPDKFQVLGINGSEVIWARKVYLAPPVRGLATPLGGGGGGGGGGDPPTPCRVKKADA